jgi:putative pyruvate formate lyase activating enzyme
MAGYTRVSTDSLKELADRAVAKLECCEICPRRCRVNRLQDERGFCRTGRLARVASYSPHFGEEAPLVGHRGSGTIFFSGCNLACVFCQNYDISQLDQGEEISAETLAKMMLALQEAGCHNINFVTPTHIVPQILEALVLAREDGLKVPLVYNSGGYDSVETLRLLDGVFDIFMPDAKYGSDEPPLKYSQSPEYTHFMKTAILEMHRQVGDLTIDKEGIAVQGLLVRHLILPDDLAGTAEVVRFISKNVSKETYLNLMPQFHPEYNACNFPELDRTITMKEYKKALGLAVQAGLTRGLAIL